jgi:hypothetical protein
MGVSQIKWQSRHCEPTGRRKAPPDDRLREAISFRRKERSWMHRDLGIAAATAAR